MRVRRSSARLLGVALLAIVALWSAPLVDGAAGQEQVQSVESGQADDAPPQAQSETGDGTRVLRLMAIAMGALAFLVAWLTFYYWKATTPPARRGYVPQEPTYRH